MTVTSAGDHELENVAGLPPTLCADGEDCTVVVTDPLLHVVADKASDPASGESLEAGQVVTYTLTFTNDGLASGPVDATDDLSDVLDDAAVTTEPTSDHEAVTVTRTDELIRIVGELPAGESATVTYQVTIGEDGERGDNVATNVLTPDVPVVECDEECVPVDPPSTTHPIGELADSKAVDPASGTTVRPGAELTYTLTFTNTGEADVTVDRDDVLTEVLDDATIVTAPVASDEALTVSDVTDGRFTVSGVLAPDQTVTVTYAVVVNADGERGDDRLANALVDTGEDVPEECVADEDGLADCTVNHVSDVRVVKSADPADGSAVDSGEEVTYTLTFTNVSTNPEAAATDVDYTDHLAGVLDDAELTGAPESSDTELLTATLSGDELRLVGSLASGEVVTVTYTVTVKDYADQGDHALVNEVAVTGEGPLCVEGSELCTLHSTVEPPAEPGTDEPGTDDGDGTGGAGTDDGDEPGRELPSTGADVLGVAGGAAFLVLLGAAGVMVALRRRTTA